MGAENFTLENVVILNWQMRTTTSQKKKSEGWNKRKHSNEYGDGPSHEENKGDEEEEERISTTHHLEAHSFEIVSPQSEKESESTLLESGTQNENNVNVGIIEDSQNGTKKKKKKKADGNNKQITSSSLFPLLTTRYGSVRLASMEELRKNGRVDVIDDAVKAVSYTHLTLPTKA